MIPQPITTPRNPPEHYDSARTSRFLETRAVEETTGSQQAALNARYTSGDYPQLYNVCTRDRQSFSPTAATAAAAAAAAAPTWRRSMLPRDKDVAGGAAYNGFTVSPDGVIFTKSLERGSPCDRSTLMTNMGIPCAAYHKLPSFLVAVDTGSAEPHLITYTQAVEFIMSRIAAGRHAGLDYVYCPGLGDLRG